MTETGITKILEAAETSSNHPQQGLFHPCGFSSLYLLFLRLSRIIVDIKPSGVLLGDSTWALESQNTVGWFQVLVYIYTSWIVLLDKLDLWYKNESDSLHFCNIAYDWVLDQNVLLPGQKTDIFSPKINRKTWESWPESTPTGYNSTIRQSNLCFFLKNFNRQQDRKFGPLKFQG